MQILANIECISPKRISGLIARMAFKGATEKELQEVIEHSMTIIDLMKRIQELERKYPDDGPTIRTPNP